MSEKRNDGGPAFPTEPNTQSGFYSHHGMSLRDWFAGQIAASIMGGLVTAKFRTTADDATRIAQNAYALADAMLAERDRS